MNTWPLQQSQPKGLPTWISQPVSPYGACLKMDPHNYLNKADHLGPPPDQRSIEEGRPVAFDLPLSRTRSLHLDAQVFIKFYTEVHPSLPSCPAPYGRT